MERRQDRSAPRVFDDHRDNLTVDVQNVLVQERASQLKSEDSQIALLWNVFRSLQNLDARLWLPRLVLQALGAKRSQARLRGLLAPSQIVEPTFHWWHRFELPPSRHEWLRDQACNATLDLTLKLYTDAKAMDLKGTLDKLGGFDVREVVPGFRVVA